MKPTKAELRRMKVNQAGQRRVMLQMDNEDNNRTKKSNTPSIPSDVLGVLKLATVDASLGIRWVSRGLVKGDNTGEWCWGIERCRWVRTGSRDGRRE